MCVCAKMYCMQWSVHLWPSRSTKQNVFKQCPLQNCLGILGRSQWQNIAPPGPLTFNHMPINDPNAKQRNFWCPGPGVKCDESTVGAPSSAHGPMSAAAAADAEGHVWTLRSPTAAVSFPEPAPRTSQRECSFNVAPCQCTLRQQHPAALRLLSSVAVALS
jgi:hypothetical protein